MNLLLLEPDELAADGTATVTGRRLRHAREVLHLQAGASLRVGVLSGAIGRGEVLALEVDRLVLRFEALDPPPRRPGIDLLLAMPRPKALKRLLPAIAALGVDRVALVNAARVEKSYFDSPSLTPEAVHEAFVWGAEQARDTMLPGLLIEPLLKPFVEDRLDAWLGPTERLLGDPSGPVALAAWRRPHGRRVALAIGPEGGWVPFERELFAAHGFTAVHAGERILRTETAVPYLLGLLAAAG